MRRHFVSGFPRALLHLSQKKSCGVEIGTGRSYSADREMQIFKLDFLRLHFNAKITTPPNLQIRCKELFKHIG